MTLAATTRSETTKQFTTSAWWVLALVLFAYIGFTAAVLAFVLSMSATGALGGEGPAGARGGARRDAVQHGDVGGLRVPAAHRHADGDGRVPSQHPVSDLPRDAAARHGAVGEAGRRRRCWDCSTASWASSRPWLRRRPSSPPTGCRPSSRRSTPGHSSDGCCSPIVLWVFVGVGVGALVRNQVGAIVGVLVFTQFIEPVARAAAAFVEGLTEFTNYLPGAASDALVGASVFTGMTPGATARAARVVGRAASCCSAMRRCSWRSATS